MMKMTQSLVFAIAMVGILALGLALPAQAEIILLEDDFNDDSIDTNKWLTEETGAADVDETGNRMQFTERGYLYTKSEFDPNDYPSPGITVKGDWTMGSGTGIYAGFSFATRSDGIPIGVYRQPQNGILCDLEGYHNKIRILEYSNYDGTNGKTTLVASTDLGFTIASGDTVELTVVDDGTNVSFTVTKGVNTKTISTTSTLDNNVDHILFCNSIHVGGHVSYLDDVKISVIPEPSTIVLLLTGLLGLLVWRRRK